jgi:hypothetical protein
MAVLLSHLIFMVGPFFGLLPVERRAHGVNPFLGFLDSLGFLFQYFLHRRSPFTFNFRLVGPDVLLPVERGAGRVNPFRGLGFLESLGFLFQSFLHGQSPFSFLLPGSGGLDRHIFDSLSGN